MSHAAPPALTVRYDGSQRTFAAGHDVVVGRDLRADMRITHPLISRAHLLLRFEQGRWRAIDNGSLNGTYANGRRVPVIDLHDGQTINIGNPDGPQLSFEIGRHDGVAGRPPQTASMPIARAGAAAHGRVPHAAAATPTGGPRRRAPAQGRRVGPARPGAAALSRRAATAAVSGPRPPAYPPGPQHQPATARPAAGPGGLGSPDEPGAENRDGAAGHQHATRSRQPGHQDDPGDPARLADTGQAAGLGDDRSRQRQRHRHPGRAGVAPSRVPGRLAARHRDPRRPQHQRHLRQRRARRLGGAQRGRRGHDRQHRPRLHRRQPGPAHRSRHPHRRPRGQRRALPDRRQGTARRHLADRPPGHADRDHRRLRRGQDHAVAADRRIHPPQLRQRHLRGPRHPRRVRDDAQPDRDGAAGRRGAPPADGQPGARATPPSCGCPRTPAKRNAPRSSRRCSRNST